MTTVSVGHTVVNTIAYLDQNGNPMVTAPTPDSPPVWTGSDGAVESLSISADGATATATALAAGTNVLTLTLTVAGKTYTATATDTVTAAPQVLTSVKIVQAVS